MSTSLLAADYSRPTGNLGKPVNHRLQSTNRKSWKHKSGKLIETHSVSKLGLTKLEAKMYEIWDQKSTENSFLLRSCQVIAPQSGFPAYFLFRFFSELCENLFYLLNKIKTNLVFIELRRDPIFGFCSSYASQEFKQFLGRFVELRPSICPFFQSCGSESRRSYRLCPDCDAAIRNNNN